LLILLFAAAGCSVYDDYYQYAPGPVLARVPPAATTQKSEPPLAALASVVGVRNADDKTKIPASVEVRLELNNDGTTEPVTLDPRTLDLRDAALARFAPPITEPPAQTITVAPGESTSLTAYFPFPPGRNAESMAMRTLQLRWTVKIGDRNVSQNVFFRLYAPPTYYYYPYPYYYPYSYYGPYWYGPYPWYGSRVVIVHDHDHVNHHW
jgi:hypothetical protein